MEQYINIENMNEGYENMKKKIESFYTNDFILNIETKNISNISFKLILDFSIFLNKLKLKDPQYLKRTKIYIYSDNVYNLLYILFTLTRPIAPVEVLFFKNNKIDIIKKFFP